jgi:hypothetical protein
MDDGGKEVNNTAIDNEKSHFGRRHALFMAVQILVYDLKATQMGSEELSMQCIYPLI